MKRLLVLGVGLLLAGGAVAADLPTTLRAAKPSVVGVGTYMTLRQQQDQLSDAGFAVAEGRRVVTHTHVVPQDIDEGRRERVAVYIPLGGNQGERRPARVVNHDLAHDVCLLRFEGALLFALRLGCSADVPEGALYASTGFPILTALGLRSVTHRGILSAISPIILPLASGKDITRENLREPARPFDVFQLDATAYPGNSGSPLYEIETGRVGWWA